MNSTEVLIVKNPIFYKDVAPEAFDALIPDGSWIPLVFNAVESVVNRYFFELCELDWDYRRDETALSDAFSTYKSISHRGLDEKQEEFVKKIADEIESEIFAAAEEARNAKNCENPE